MPRFKNKNYTTRDYECTNVVFCEGEQAPNANWVETDEEIPVLMSQLFIENGVKYFGWM